MSHATSTQDRVIRVFVSSTFRDMHAERDELVLKIFPQLRRLCEERGVIWGEIDLRWGITEEQSLRGEVLPICLEEIKRCRPYFIGLLGERYGWIPAAVLEVVLEREPWIKVHVDGEDKKSVTELEIMHGVLNNPEMADHAFFYFRDPTFIDRLPAKQKKVDFVSEDDQHLQKLNRLKNHIRQQHRDGMLKYKPRENYQDAKSLGEFVLTDFTALIDSLYPKGQEPSPLQRERIDHEAFARSRANVYIGRQGYFDQLDAHVASDAGPLVVLGESGGGKSALLANWAMRFREQHPEHFLLLHFIGASPDSANAIGLLRRVMLELKERFDLPDDVPVQADKIRESFPNWLTKVATEGPIVLVLDALNQLEDVDAAPDLGWLPRVFPKNCRVIVSTLPGRSLEAIRQRSWLAAAAPPLYVHPLDDSERKWIIRNFLKQYTRELGPSRTEHLVCAPQTSNPLYLCVLLNELRVFGLHEKLNEQIERYLEAQDLHELYRKVISRWEEAYSGGTELVRDTLSMIWASRRGLSEAELLDVLGSNGDRSRTTALQRLLAFIKEFFLWRRNVHRRSVEAGFEHTPLPRAAWSPLFLAMSDALVSRSGLLTFAHDFLRNAVRDTYLSTDPQQQQAHQRLADYFQRQPGWRDRKLDELPWQLAKAREWQRLHDTITMEPCFLRLSQQNMHELLGYWLQLKPQFDLATSYTTAFAHWTQDQPGTPSLAYVANQVFMLLQTAACHAEAEPLMRRSLDILEKSYGASHPEVATALNNLAVLLEATNRLAEAESMMRRALDIEERTYGAEHTEVANVLNNLAGLLHKTNRLAEAESLMRRALDIEERTYGAEHTEVASVLNNLAGLLHSTNRLAEAELLMRRALAIDEKTYGTEHPEVASVLNNLAVLLQTTNRLAEAEPLLRRALAIDEKSYGPEHPSVASRLNNLATLLQATDRLAEAELLKRRALAIDQQSYGVDHPLVASRMINLAALLHDTNRLAEAEPLIRRALVIDEKSYGTEHPDVARDLQSLAALLQGTNRLVEAEPLMRRALAIHEQSFGTEHPEVATDINYLAALLQATNRLEEAEPLKRRALAIDERTYGADHPRVAIDLSNLALLLQATNRLAEAEPLMRQALTINEQSYGAEHHQVALILNNLACLLRDMNRLVEAEPLMRRALAIDEQTYGTDHPNVARDLNNLGLLLQATNRLAEAEPLLRRMVGIFFRFLETTGHPHPNMQAAFRSYSGLLQSMGMSKDKVGEQISGLMGESLKSAGCRLERMA